LLGLQSGIEGRRRGVVINLGVLKTDEHLANGFTIGEDIIGSSINGSRQRVLDGRTLGKQRAVERRRAVWRRHRQRRSWKRQKRVMLGATLTLVVNF
jgi:hypothetical protein